MEGDKELPRVDLSPIFTDGADNWKTVAKELGKCLHRIGFVYISGHGISSDLLSKCFGATKKLLTLPDDVKRKYRKADPTKDFTGFFMTGEESLDEKTFEFKQSYDIQQNQKKVPAEVPEYEALSEEMVNECEDLKDKILKLLALSLDLEDEDYFVNLSTYKKNPDVSNKTGLRALRYPALPENFELKEGMMRCAEHTDWGLITFLFQDDVGGLQVKNRAGEWIEVPPIPGTFILNAGGMLEVLTRGYFPASWHRIPMTEESERVRKDRYSIGFFFILDDESMLEPLEEAKKFSDVENFQFKPRTVLEYMNDRIVKCRVEAAG